MGLNDNVIHAGETFCQTMGVELGWF